MKKILLPLGIIIVMGFNLGVKVNYNKSRSSTIALTSLSAIAQDNGESCSPDGNGCYDGAEEVTSGGTYLNEDGCYVDWDLTDCEPATEGSCTYSYTEVVDCTE